MHRLLLFLVFYVMTFQLKAEVRLPDFFNDNMVLQRNKDIRIWGWADRNERITVSFNGEIKKTKANKNGEWYVVFKKMTASSSPKQMTITGRNEIILNNILIGDVWICSGQSNMNYTIDRFPYAQIEADQADYPEIRMITVKKELSVLEENKLTAGNWVEAKGNNIFSFSATAYFFGRELYKDLNIPIGLIATSWGGTNVEAWMSPQSISKFHVLDSIFQVQKKDLLDQNLEAKKAERLRIIDENVRTGIGIDEKWYLTESNTSDWKQMEVPMKKENALFENADGALWLKKEFEIPLPFRGKDLKFNLGQTNDYSKVWINGHEIGESTRAEKWINYIVQKGLLKPGKNQITVRVFDYQDSGGWVTDPYFINFHPVGEKKGYYLLSGDWKFKVGKVLKKPLELPRLPNNLGNLTREIPSCLYNKMIHPLTNLSITGAIWYQGESNSLRGYEYSQFFPEMIQGWREEFNQGDFPFLFVQLPNFQGKTSRGKENTLPNWPELRYAQSKAIELPNIGMAVTIDVGEAKDIHPKNKQDVGKRLALAALGMHYDKNTVYQSPKYSSMKSIEGALHLTFTNYGSDLKNTNKDFMGPMLNHFEVSDQQGNFHPAKAKIIDKSTIMVWSDEVSKPIDVRYAWKNNPEQINFYNSVGLPVIPFRTDQWQWESKGSTYLKSIGK